MKRISVLIVCIVILVLSMGACNDEPPVFPNEPGGFRGILWGQDASTATGLAPRAIEGPIATYVRPNEKLTIGEVPLTEITYTFFKNRFYSVMVEFDDYANYRDLKKQLSTLYGPGEQVASVWRSQWWWYGANLNIRLVFSQITQSGTLVYSYIPIYEEYTAYKMEQSRRGSGEI